MDMQLPKPAVPYRYTRLCSDMNCQSTRCVKKKCPVRPECDGKNCQSAKHMCYDKKCHVKSESEGTRFSAHMQSVLKTACK